MLPPSKSSITVPEGACDCHVHVFGPYDTYPLSAGRSYTPPVALIDDLFARMDAAGVDRAVVVQPSAYGTDNRVTLDAVRPRLDRLRAVAVIDGRESDAALEAMHAAGARGVRLNIISGGGPDDAGFDVAVRRVAERIAPLRWHVQIFAPLALIVANARVLEQLPVDVVLDHMGQPQAAAGLDQPDLDTLLGLLRQDKFWVKLSGTYRVSPDLHGNAQVTALARKLAAVCPDRAVWGSDWPHTGSHKGKGASSAQDIGYRPVDYGRLLSAAAEWVSDPDALYKVLVANPARLYGF